jgi:hypothetical protein
VAPIDGQEYTSRRGGAKTQEAEAKTKKGDRQAVRSDKSKRLAVRGHHGVTKQARTVKLSKGARTARLSKGRTM